MFFKLITLIIVVLLAVIGFALRLYRLDFMSFRGDEAFTVIHWVSEPLSSTLANIVTVDPHPPLAYALFRGWSLLVGRSEFVMRLLPALINILGIPALYALGHRIGGRFVGISAALLWAFHPYEIWHSQDARNYAIWAGLSAVALWLALSALDRRRRLDWILYICAALLTAYVYYLEVFVLIALNCFVLIGYWRNRRLLLLWLGIQGVIGLGLAPWYLQERLLVGSGYGGTTGGFDGARLLTWFLPALVFGETIPASWNVFLWPVLLIMLLFGLSLVWRHDHRRGIFLALLVMTPTLLLCLSSLKLNIFTPRYIMGIIPGLVMLLAFSIQGLFFKNKNFTVGWIVMGSLLGMNIYSLYNHFFVIDYAKADWRSLIRYLDNQVHTDDIVIQAAADEAFNYYYNLPVERKQLPANPTQSAQEIADILEDGQKHHRSIWLVAQTFPDWPSAGIVEEWLGSEMQIVRNTHVKGLRIQQFMPWEVKETFAKQSVMFGETVSLVGAYVSPEQTNDLTIWLYWLPLEPTQTPLKIFVHLIGSTNPNTNTPLWSQDDQFPQDGRISSTTWTTTTFRDVYTLPLSAVSPGTYTLEIGLYNPANGDRLTTATGDTYELQELTLP